MHPLRNHRSYLAAMGHRLSGIALALFLPLHFLLLGTALNGAAGMNRFLVYGELPLVKVAEWGLVSLLALHLLFGLRVLLLEFTSWPRVPNRFAIWVVPAAILAIIIGVVFLLRVS